LRGPAKEQAADQIDAVVEVEVHRGRGEQHQAEAECRDLDRDEAADEAEQAVRRMDVPVLRMDGDRLDLGAAAETAKALGDPHRCPPLGVGAGEPVLERAELADDLDAGCDIHER
jgi:hypothetical protein